jgi:hypothetical protein
MHKSKSSSSFWDDEDDGGHASPPPATNGHLADRLRDEQDGYASSSSTGAERLRRRGFAEAKGGEGYFASTSSLGSTAEDEAHAPHRLANGQVMFCSWEGGKPAVLTPKGMHAQAGSSSAAGMRG